MKSRVTRLGVVLVAFSGGAIVAGQDQLSQVKGEQL
jgi:hypothetical protein